jgi:hypothetical protein
MVIYRLHNKLMKRKSSVVASASYNELTCFDLMRGNALLLLQFLRDIYSYNHSLIQIPNTFFILLILQVNASNIVEGAAQFFFVIKLSEDLSDLVIIKKSLVVISCIERRPCYLNGLGQVAECIIQNIYLMISLLVVQHDIVSIFPFFDRVFLLDCHFFFFLMLLDNLFDLFLKFDDRASDLGCELLDAARYKDHQNQSDD